MVDTQKLVKERRKRERQALYRVIKEKIKEHIDLDDSEEEETMTLAKV